jgi:N-acetylmuramoyl-L-alanine amidase
MKKRLLPFYNERKAKIDMIVLHCQSYGVEDAINVFMQREVSAHYLIDEKGEIWNLVDEKYRAWHAGVSFWRGIEDINSHSIGIELCSKTMGQKRYSLQQKNSLIFLLETLVKKYDILPYNIVGHSDIAPNRKVDPGKEFFWRDLAKKGFGFWYDKKKADNIINCKEENLLEEIGFDIKDLDASRLAFCRHFIPKSIVEDKDIMNMEKNITKNAKEFIVPDNYFEVLQNIAQQYARASRNPCKI